MNWKPVKNYENYYEVSDCGQVRKMKCKTHLSQWVNDEGYCYVRVSNPRRVLRVHRLVALAFLDNPEQLPVVNHIDFVRHNNHSWNLEWCTQWHNLNHSANFRRMQRDYWKGKRSPNATISDSDVKAIREEYAKGGISWQALGDKYKVNKRTIGRIVKNESYAPAGENMKGQRDEK